jgi:hypothetical protein
MPKHVEGCKDGSAWESVCVREWNARVEGVEVRVEVRTCPNMVRVAMMD